MRKFIILAALASVCISSMAQNIKQSVEVSNDYRSSFADFRKQSTKISIADTLYRFNYHFDYSVFDSPYKGSYEFEPYQVELQLDTISYSSSDLFLRIGAGVMPHPELDFSWNPFQSETYGLSLSNRGRGRIGYFAPSQSLSAARGYDLSDSFSIHSRSLFGSNRIDFSAGYDGIFTKCALDPSAYNSGYARLAYSSKSFLRLFACEADLTIRYYGDNLATSHSYGSNTRLQGRLSPLVSGNVVYSVDFDFEMDNLSDNRPEIANLIRNYSGITPNAKFVWDNTSLSLGAKFEYGYDFNIAPMIRFDWEIRALRMRIFAGTKGGQSLNNYHKLKTLNHFYTISPISSAQTKNFSSEKIDAFLGASGTIGKYFHYRLHAGYRRADALLLDAMPSADYSALAYADVRNPYAGLNVKLKSSRVDIDANVEYNQLRVLSYSGSAFAPAAVRGSVSGSYNWLKRVYAGVMADFSSARTSLNPAFSDLAWWCDLGLYSEYRFNKAWGAYLRLGNLLGMRIEKQPGFVEKDPYLTVGFTFNGR